MNHRKKIASNMEVGKRIDILYYLSGEMIPIYNVKPLHIGEKTVKVHCPIELVDAFGLDVYTPHSMPIVHLQLCKIKYISHQDRFLVGADHKVCNWTRSFH